jgi:D-alanine-D-alanine ligase
MKEPKLQEPPPSGTNKDKSEPPSSGKNGNGKVCLGPINQLEEHTRPDWWKNIFNSLYLKTDGDVVEDPRITSDEIDLFLKILSPAKDARMLDLCCGQGRHSREIAKRGFTDVEGLDRSRYLIQRARYQARRSHLNVRFREGDARKLPHSPDTFEYVMIMGNSFGYFETIQDDLTVLREVLRVLKPWGRILLDITDGEYLKTNFQPRSWEWIDKKHFVCRERSLSTDDNRLISREVITNIDEGVIADQFYAERLYTKQNITDLLVEAGFSDIAFHGAILTDSQRNQDLGMMGKRLVITAVAKKEWTPVKTKKRQKVKNVVVLFGDPNRPDILKPDSVFDDDDIYTIDQLKSALREFKGYNFTYLDKHDSIAQDLSRMKDKIDYVFNLCDEGYNNEATKELHIPALLEIMNIPYTGSNPQCLAYCYDKSLIRGIAKEMEIPVPEAMFIKPQDKSFELYFEPPVIIKPNFGDSSYGITQNSVANSIEEIISAVSEIRDRFGYNKPILIEQFLTGSDISVGIIGNSPDSYTVLPVTEEDYSALPPELPRICGYEAKWKPDSPYWKIKSIPATLPDSTYEALIDWCMKLIVRLECRDYTRLDWRLDSEGVPRLLEVNPNPGWCWDGHLAKMAKFAGISYREMHRMILQSAEKRLKLFDNEQD